MENKQIEPLKQAGMLASSGNAMRIAQRRSRYQKIDLFGGMFLQEHLRSVDPIIAFNNEEVYGGQLIPLRGKKNKYTFPYQMGYIDIEGEAIKSGSSKINIVEANAIVQWLIQNKTNILEQANHKAQKHYELKNVVAILTPFKHQATLIKLCLRRANIQGITVGTVHTMQGQERDIMLFSAVDTSHDHKAFYDRSINMLNVTVSRAKENFIVFANWNKFGKIPNTPSFLLRKHIPDEHCLPIQKTHEYETIKFINETKKQKTPTHPSDEKTIINVIDNLIITDNKGQIIIADRDSNITAIFNQTNQSSSKPTK